VQASHTVGAVSVRFDEPSLVSCAGLVPVLRLAEHHREHAIIEQVNADLTGLRPGPPGVALAAIADNLTRAAGCLASMFTRAPAPAPSAAT
jgi:hypothetical protein